jgi:hypothetical protein
MQYKDFSTFKQMGEETQGKGVFPDNDSYPPRLSGRLCSVRIVSQPGAKNWTAQKDIKAPAKSPKDSRQPGLSCV